jgi:catechol 2,3-dioxygenase
MEMGAALAQLELFSAKPLELAAFYRSTFALGLVEEADRIVCSAPGRTLVIREGRAGQLCRASYRFHDVDGFAAHRQALRSRAVTFTEEDAESFCVRDPEGRLISFLAPLSVPATEAPETGPHRARLQHFGVRTPTPAPLVAFYAEQLGFIVSDRVLDADGNLTAAFLRTDAEHHSMAIFRAPELRFDHFSCEAENWLELRDWADHMARVGVDLAWGIGRHGPGNDNFLMVRDPEGSMGEVSCDLEVCPTGRPEGVWPHRPQTLNQWGVAIMRS